MSAYVAGLCYEVRFGCPTTKSVAVALADHASQDGSKAFPSIRLIADKCEISPRTVQRALRRLEEMGVLVVVKEGGCGPRDTREWRFDLHLLRTVAATADKQVMQTDKGDTVSLLIDELRVTSETPKGDTDDNKGDTGDTRTVNNHQEPRIAPLPPSPAEAPSSGQVDLSGSKGKRYRPSIEIQSGDVTWPKWLEHVATKFGQEAADAIAAAGRILAHSRWPSDDASLPEIAR